jgi:RNA 2',3'-cyclic 3'-phosphodiesterase
MSTPQQLAGRMPALPAFRTFIAIELSPDVRARAVQHIASLRRDVPEVRASFSREDNLHLTLKFLGNVRVADIPKISDAVERATSTVSPFELEFSSCGTFPPHGRPSVLWIGARSAGALPTDATRSSNLDRLYSAIEEELAAAGFARESRPFHPHLTIARLRHSQGARQLAELHKKMGFAPISFGVSEVVVFKSELFKDGSKHTAISRHNLG